MDNNQQTKVQQPDGTKRPYAAPKLIQYGDLRSITQSGSGSKQENSGKDPQPDKFV
jgi:hypothetical protein